MLMTIGVFRFGSTLCVRERYGGLVLGLNGFQAMTKTPKNFQLTLKVAESDLKIIDNLVLPSFSINPICRD